MTDLLMASSGTGSSAVQMLTLVVAALAAQPAVSRILSSPAPSNSPARSSSSSDIFLPSRRRSSTWAEARVSTAAGCWSRATGCGW